MAFALELTLTVLDGFSNRLTFIDSPFRPGAPGIILSSEGLSNFRLEKPLIFRSRCWTHFVVQHESGLRLMKISVKVFYWLVQRATNIVFLSSLMCEMQIHGLIGSIISRRHASMLENRDHFS
jgi:hypothetical protein